MPFPLSESELQKTELKLGLRFPDAFRRAMVAMNGGEVLTDEDQWDIYPFFDTSPTGSTLNTQCFSANYSFTKFTHLYGRGGAEKEVEVARKLDYKDSNRII
jgi:hypothetical protein